MLTPMNPQINLTPETRKSRPRWSALSSSVDMLLIGAYRIQELSYIPNPPSRPTATVTPSGCVKLCNKTQHEISDFVPAHPDRLPGAGRITRKIYGWGGLAESMSTMGTMDKVLKIKDNLLILVKLSAKKVPWVDIPLIIILSFAERVSLCLKKEVMQ